MKKLRQATVLALAGLLAVSMAACGGSTGSSSAPEAAPSGDAPAAESSEAAAPAASGEAVQLDVWHYFSLQDGDRFKEFCEQYDAENDNVTVAVTYVLREDLLKQYTMGAVSGELPDIGMIDNPDHASFAAMGVFEDITEQLAASGDKDKFFEGPMKSCVYEERVYGLPHNSNCLALFINNTMLQEKGLTAPTTWDELMAASEALTDPANGVYGMSMCARNDEEGTFQFMPWFLSAGGDISDLSSENTVRALDYLKELVDKGYMSQDVINWRQSDVVTQFVNGKSAMMLNGPWNVPVIAQDAPDMDYSVVLVPKDEKFASVLGGENFAVCKGAPLQEAYDMLHWLCSEQVMADFCEAAGKFPPRSDSMALKTVWTEDPVYSVFGSQMEYAMPRGPHPRWPEVSTAISTAMTEVLTGVKSSQDALNEAAATYESIMNS